MKYFTIFIIFLIDKLYHQIKIFNYFRTIKVDIKCIYDLGAHNGQYSKHFSEIFLNSKILCFEPNIVLFNELKKKFINKHNFYIFNLAISSKNEKLNMIIDNEISKTSSASKINYDSNTFKLKKILYSSSIKKNVARAQLVEAVSLDSFISKNNFKPDIVKIDVEGYEYKALLGFSKNIKFCKYIIYEHHYDELYIDSDVDKIDSFLKEYNFTLLQKFKFPFMKWEDRLYKNKLY